MTSLLTTISCALYVDADCCFRCPFKWDIWNFCYIACLPFAFSYMNYSKINSVVETCFICYKIIEAPMHWPFVSLACRFIIQAIHALVSSLLYKFNKHTCWPEWSWSRADNCHICCGIHDIYSLLEVWYLNLEYHQSPDDNIFQVLIHNVMRIGSSKDVDVQQAHEFSIYLVLPFLTTSLALLAFNW
jgi:hypothetical protein